MYIRLSAVIDHGSYTIDLCCIIVLMTHAFQVIEDAINCCPLVLYLIFSILQGHIYAIHVMGASTSMFANGSVLGGFIMQRQQACNCILLNVECPISPAGFVWLWSLLLFRMLELDLSHHC